MPKIRQLIREKFGYTTNLPNVSHDMHLGPTERHPPVKDNPAYLPVEKYRNVIKALLGATTTEEDSIVENVVDFASLQRLAAKHGFSKQFESNLNTIQVEIDKKPADRDRALITKTWEELKENIPFWFLGMLPDRSGHEMPEEDKALLSNLQDIMKEFNKNAEKHGKEKSKDTEHASRDTAAKDSLDKARKDANMDNLDAGGEKKMAKKPENKNALGGKDKK